MRLLRKILIFCVFLLLIGYAVLHSVVVFGALDEAMVKSKDINEAILEEDVSKAYLLSEGALNWWKSISPILCTMMVHSTVQEIENGFVSIKAALKNYELNEAYIFSEQLNVSIAGCKDGEVLNFGNIL